MVPVAPPGSGLVHDAFFHDDMNALVGTVVPFVRDGVERDEMVLVNTGKHPLTSLLKALFADENAVQFGAPSVYDHPVSVLDDYKRTMDRALARGTTAFRAVGHIDFDNSALPWREWLRYEAAFDKLLAEYPMRTLCPYDTRTLAPEIVTAMKRVHPSVVEGGRQVANPDHVPPEHLVTFPEYTAPRDPLQKGEPQLEIVPVDDLRALRLDLYPPTFFTDLPRRKVDDFVKAAVEVASNGLTHGVEPVRVRLWTSPDRLVCTVTDQGNGIADPLQGYVRPGGGPDAESVSPDGLGLWAARELCDILDYGHGPDGFTVRLISFSE